MVDPKHIIINVYFYLINYVSQFGYFKKRSYNFNHLTINYY